MKKKKKKKKRTHTYKNFPDGKTEDFGFPIFNRDQSALNFETFEKKKIIPRITSLKLIQRVQLFLSRPMCTPSSVR